jgi:phosphopentomutase
MKRAIVIVIDALGIGALPDAAEFGDAPGANTLGNVARVVDDLRLPNLCRLGLGHILSAPGIDPVAEPLASYGEMLEISRGKDTTTGHWELAGLVLEKPFETFPEGFPEELLSEFVRRSGCGGILGNIPASGTEIIERFNDEHERTGYPIIYTSADSVFQIACNMEKIPHESLYDWCEAARAVLDERASVSRVIARPYQRDSAGNLVRLSGARRDYAVPPPRATILDEVMAAERKTIAIGKIEDIFCGSGVTHSVHTSGNAEGLSVTIQVLGGELDYAGASVGKGKFLPREADEFIFVNLVDTDSLYGHRRDPRGYGRALEEIDAKIPDILARLGADDLLILTGDHGCDPTAPGTDHTRERVPLLVFNPATPARPLGTLASFTWVADSVAKWLDIAWQPRNIQL